MRGWRRLGAVAGIAGPVAFTAGWVVASLRQTGYSATQVQISGLAAPDARDPEIMIAAFVILGGCSVAFGDSLHRALRDGGCRPGPGPRLIQGTGLLAVAAGALVTAGFLGVFAADTSANSAGVLQRIAATIPLGAMAAVAARLLWLTRPRRRGPATLRPLRLMHGGACGHCAGVGWHCPGATRGRMRSGRRRIACCQVAAGEDHA